MTLSVDEETQNAVNKKIISNQAPSIPSPVIGPSPRILNTKKISEKRKKSKTPSTDIDCEEEEAEMEIDSDASGSSCSIYYSIQLKYSTLI